MFDVGQLLGALLQGGVSGGGGKRLENAGGGDLLGQILGGVLGGGQAPGANAGGGLGSLGDLAGSLLGGGGKGALSGGAMALLSSLAMQALQKYSGGGGGQALSSSMQLMAGLRTPVNEEETRQVQDLTLLTVRAMLNAAKADGQVDEAELQRILGKFDKSGIDPAAREFIREELSKPMDTDGLAAQVSNPQVAAQIYTASLLAIEVDTEAEQRYLRELAAKLNLEAGVVGQIHTMLGVAPAR
jgi:uncharacterized membrane protein YebE (DUF533 family)